MLTSRYLYDIIQLQKGDDQASDKKGKIMTFQEFIREITKPSYRPNKIKTIEGETIDMCYNTPELDDEQIKAIIIDFLISRERNNGIVRVISGNIGVSVQKVSAMCRQLVKSGKLIESETRDCHSNYRKCKLYSVAIPAENKIRVE